MTYYDNSAVSREKDRGANITAGYEFSAVRFFSGQKKPVRGYKRRRHQESSDLGQFEKENPDGYGAVRVIPQAVSTMVV